MTLDDWGVAAALSSRKSTFRKGDVLFGKIRPYFHKVSLAPLDGICSTDALVLRPVAGAWGVTVLTLSSEEFVDHATQTSNGTKMPRADWKVIRNFPVVRPDRSISDRFSEMVRSNLELAQALMFCNRELAAMRDALLPKLVSGQIDVSKLNLDELVGSVS